MAGFFDPPDSGNPFALAPAQTLGMMLSGLGSGITAASARNLPAYYGIAPGAQAFENSYNNLLTRGANYDLANKNYQLNASYKNMQEKQLELQTQALQQKLGFMKKLGEMAETPGFGNTPPPLMGPQSWRSSIAGIESAGQPNGGYSAVGPETPQGRAYGKYQVMEGNIGPWTQEVLGKSMTPQEFLANPQAQDAVFDSKFGQYAQKYGPQGAARAWFAGEGGMNNPNAADANGTTVAGYGQRFAQASPQGQPPGLPPMPGPPPDTSRVQIMGALAGMPGVGTALAQRPNQLYKYQTDTYARQIEAAKLQQQIANGDLIPGPNGTWVPNTAKAEMSGATAAATEKAKAQAHTDYVFPPGVEDPNKTPDQKLALLPANIRGVVKDLGPGGSLALSDLPTRMAASGIDPSKVDIMSLAKGIYGDQFDLRQREAQKNFMTDIYQGNKPEGATRLALITALQHIDTFASLVKAQANGDYPTMNAIAKAWNDQSGNPKFSGAEALMQFLAPEAAKVVKGGNQLNEKEVEDNKEMLLNTKSWPQASTILQTWLGAMLARKNGLEDTARSLGVPDAKIARFWGTGVNGQPSSMQKAISNFYAVTGGDLVHGPAQPQGAQPASQQQGQAQPQGTPYREGMTATNPQTGQKAIFRGGKWQVIQ